MKIEINPQESSRGDAYNLWMSSPMPMVTLTKSFDISRIVRAARRKGMKFNALLCWCVAKAATQMEVFYTLPEQGKLYRYDRIAVNVIVENRNGGINSCDVPFTHSIDEFMASYNTLTARCAEECSSSFLEDCMIIGTSAVIHTELDCIVNQYTDKFCNPMVMWGKYRKKWFKTTLPISFQLHHVQMDGGHAAQFLSILQGEICSIR